MSKELAQNEWGVIVELERLLELRWLPCTATMTDGGFMVTLCLLALEAEKTRPRGLLIDAVEFHHSFSAELMAWRDAHVVLR